MSIIDSVFGSMGITTIQKGNKTYQITPPKTINQIEGFGDTIKVGDVFYDILNYDTNKEFLEGPVQLDAVSANPDDPWYRFIRPTGGRPTGNYKGSGWKRTFRLAEPEVADKLKAALKYKNLYVRLYFTFNNLQTPARPCLINAGWIAWTALNGGNLQEALQTADTPYGKFKKKNIVKWIKSCMYTDFTMKSKVAIPDDFPVKL